jgi:DNA-binding MarR family transcriptional regulator
MKREPTPSACAAALLEAIPKVMQAIRAEMRGHRPADLSVQHFRSMAFVQRSPGASLSDLAEHVGLSLPAMSSLVERLVGRGLVERQTDPADRRRVTLRLSALGEKTIREAREATRARLAALVSRLSDADRASIIGAMQALQGIFTPG